MMVRQKLLALTAVLAVAGCAVLQPRQAPERNAALRLDRGLEALEGGHYREAFDDLAWVYSNCPVHENGVRALTALAAMELDPRNLAARPSIGTQLLGRLIQTQATPGWIRPMAETGLLTAVALGAAHPDGPAETDVADSTRATPADTTVDPAAVPNVADSATAAAASDPATADSATAVMEAPPTPTATLAVARTPDPRLRAFGPGERDPVYGCGDAIDTDDWTPPALPRLPGPSMADMLLSTEANRDAMALQMDSLRQRLETVNEQLTATRAELERIRKTLRP
jgi:hypothetical protein